MSEKEKVKAYEQHKRDQVLEHKDEKVYVQDSVGKSLRERVIREGDNGTPYVKYQHGHCPIDSIVNTAFTDKPTVTLRRKF